MAFYQDIKEMNVYRHIKPLVARGSLGWNEAKTKLKTNMIPELIAPWHHIRESAGNEMMPANQCSVWKDILFNYIIKALPKEQQFVPSHCHECYKVVVKPRNVYELFALDGLMVRLGYTSKCGIELRDTTFRNYGGYFYTRSLEAGRARYQEVKALLADHPALKETPLILKRGCTEYEVAEVQGGTDKWEVTPQQKAIESLFYALIENEEWDWSQPDFVVADTYQAWVERAFHLGDGSYTEFTDGMPLYPEYKTYEEE